MVLAVRSVTYGRMFFHEISWCALATMKEASSILERFFPGRSRRAAARRYEQDLVERLTEPAREVVVLAWEEARHLNHN